MFESEQDRFGSNHKPWQVRVKPEAHETAKDISGCAIVGICCTDGQLIDGRDITSAIANMHDRGNGLGGGFAAYGIYPQYAEFYAFHVMYDGEPAVRECEKYLGEVFDIVHQETIPTHHVAAIKNRPLFTRYFVQPRKNIRERFYDMNDDDIVVMAVMHVNAKLEGAFVFSSGKNMGAFKGVGYPEEIAEFFRIQEYAAYLWTAHGRFPTNTSGWWGGAHPFGILDWTVVHNGEISSYGTNRRYLANFGYECSLHTDTEVVAYLFDLLIRKHRLPAEIACMAFAPPLWEVIDKLSPQERALLRAVRITYAPALLNGPFSIVVGFSGGMIALNDRIKLRPMTAARHGQRIFVASEEAAIRTICEQPDEVWNMAAGEPLVATVKGITNNNITFAEEQTFLKMEARSAIA